ncbi:MAG: acyl-CoA dehydrogenase family protein [Candidatus Hydrothermales bacterium]
MFGELVSNIENEEHKLLRETVKKFVRDKITPIASKIDETDEFPKEIFKEISELGFTGILIPEIYGGLGEDLVSACIVLEEIAKESPPLALSLLAHSVLCAHPITRFGNKEQKEKFLPKLAKGEIIGALAITEPDAGSDAASIKTVALEDEKGFTINGSKIFITNGSLADLIILYAKTSPEKGKEGISAFIFETNTKGFYVSKKFEKMGMRGSPTAALFFDNAYCPRGNLLGEKDKGFNILVKCFEVERITIASISLGIAMSALEWQIRYSRERKQFNKFLYEFQMVSEKIAENAAKLEVIRTYLYFFAKNYNFLKDNRMESATIKFLASKLGVKSSLDAIQILGGYGYTKEYPVERYLRDAKLMDIGAGTSEIMKYIISKVMIEKFV